MYRTNLLTVFAKKVAAVGNLGLLAHKLPGYAVSLSTASYFAVFVFALSLVWSVTLCDTATGDKADAKYRPILRNVANRPRANGSCA